MGCWWRHLAVEDIKEGTKGEPWGLLNHNLRKC